MNITREVALKLAREAGVTEPSSSALNRFAQAASDLSKLEIEQLTARVRELEDECRKVSEKLAAAQEELRSRDDFIAMLQETQNNQLAAAQEANEHWQRATAENENKWIEANDKLAAPKAENEWQPIETAPKCSSTVILGFDPSWYDIATPMFWSKKKSNWRFYQIDEEIRPTHWMPLPKAPNGASL